MATGGNNEQTVGGKQASQIKQGSSQVTLAESNPEPPQKTNRDLVLDLFSNAGWATQPIVVCTFTTYLDPKYEDIYFPAEVGLATFTLKDGVIDNFGRVIDPGKPPIGYRMHVRKIATRLGLPYPRANSDFANVESLMLILESYLDKYRGQLPLGALYVFALDDDVELVTHCFDWLNKKTGRDCPIRVLSLSLFAHLASPSSPVGMRRSDEPSSLLPHVSKHRRFGKPLTYCFYYSRAHPLTKYGLFNSEKEVTDSLRRAKGYNDFHELCCIYHFKKRTGKKLCALNEANRHVFHILDVLTLSNEIEIIPGGHYPQLKGQPRQTEIARRHGWIANWGITALETNLRTPPAEIRRAQGEPQSQSNSPETSETGGKRLCLSSDVATEEEPAHPSQGDAITYDSSEDSDSQSRWFRLGPAQSSPIQYLNLLGQGSSDGHDLGASLSPGFAHVRGRMYDIFDGPIPGLDVSTAPIWTGTFDLGPPEGANLEEEADEPNLDGLRFSQDSSTAE